MPGRMSPCGTSPPSYAATVCGCRAPRTSTTGRDQRRPAHRVRPIRSGPDAMEQPDRDHGRSLAVRPAEQHRLRRGRRVRRPHPLRDHVARAVGYREPRQPAPGSYPTTTPTITQAQDNVVRQYSAFAEDRWKVTNSLSLVGGLRWDTHDFKRIDLVTPVPTSVERIATPVNWRGGAVYEVAQDLNVYAQYSIAATDAQQRAASPRRRWRLRAAARSSRPGSSSHCRRPRRVDAGRLSHRQERPADSGSAHRRRSSRSVPSRRPASKPPRRSILAMACASRSTERC